MQELIDLNASATPTFVIGEEVFMGFDPAKVLETWEAYNA